MKAQHYYTTPIAIQVTNSDKSLYLGYSKFHFPLSKPQHKITQ